MNTDASARQSGVRYEADERPPLLLTIGLGLQIALLTVGGVVLTVAIVSRAGGASESFLTWGCSPRRPSAARPRSSRPFESAASARVTYS